MMAHQKSLMCLPRLLSCALALALGAKAHAGEVSQLVCLIPPPGLLSIWGAQPLEKIAKGKRRVQKYVFRGLGSSDFNFVSSDSKQRDLIVVRGGASWEAFYVYNYNLRENFEYFSKTKKIVLTQIFRDFGSMASYYQSTGTCELEVNL